MKQKLTVVLTLSFVLLTMMSFTQNDKWFLLESEEYGYTIEFPEKPSKNNQVVNSEIGELKMNIFMFDASQLNQDENLIYLVNCTVYPDSIVNSDSTENLADFFRNSIDGAVSNVKGKLLSEKPIKLGEYSGREARVDFRDGIAVISMRLFLVKNKMYLIQTITKTENDKNKSIIRFMDSFQLL